MRGFAKITIAGNLTRDPELRSTQSGRNVASFGVAVNRNRRDASGNQNEEVTFYNCTAWGAQAENINRYLHKGDPILLSGRPYQSTWRGRDGADRTSLEVDVDDFVFLGGGNRDNNGSYAGSTNGNYGGYQSDSSMPSVEGDVVLSDIPEGDISLSNPFENGADQPSAPKGSPKTAKKTKTSKDAKSAKASGEASGKDGAVVEDIAEVEDISLSDIPF